MKVLAAEGDTLTLAAADVRELTVRVVAILRDLGVELTGLEEKSRPWRRCSCT